MLLIYLFFVNEYTNNYFSLREKSSTLMKKIIITGANGFIGSSLIKRCIEEQIKVIAINNTFEIKRFPDSDLVTKIETNIDDIDELFNLIPKDEYDAFYHFAWLGVNANDRNNFEIQKGNIDLCLNCIKLASKLHVKKFILPGSTSEYLYYGKPINKDAIPSPINAYGSVKIALRYLAQEYSKQLNVDFIYAVITGIYAADRKDNNVIFYTIDSLLNNKKPSLTKLEQLWDYVNIKDVINALILIGERGVNGGFYTIGHGDNCPLNVYINKIHSIINKNLPLGIGEIQYENNILPSSCVDLTSLKEIGYVPSVDFDDGITEVIKSMKGVSNEK